MIRYLKVLGLALVILIAMNTAASSAPAATFTSSAHTSVITGFSTTSAVFTINSQPIVCKSLHSYSHVAPTTGFATFLTRPYYSFCTGLSEAVSAKVTGFGDYGETKTCEYLINASGTMDLVCQAGADVTLDAGTCTVHIPGQTGIGTIDYSNVAGGDIEVNLTINNIKGTQTDGFLCPFNGSGSFTNGALSGKILLEGLTSEGKNVNIAHDA